MKTLLSLLTFGLLASSAVAAEPDTRLFEMRVYYAAEGKLDALSTPASATTPSSSSPSMA